MEVWSTTLGFQEAVKPMIILKIIKSIITWQRISLVFGIFVNRLCICWRSALHILKTISMINIILIFFTKRKLVLDPKSITFHCYCFDKQRDYRDADNPLGSLLHREAYESVLSHTIKVTQAKIHDGCCSNTHTLLQLLRFETVNHYWKFYHTSTNWHNLSVVRVNGFTVIKCYTYNSIQKNLYYFRFK